MDYVCVMTYMMILCSLSCVDHEIHVRGCSGVSSAVFACDLHKQDYLLTDKLQDMTSISPTQRTLRLDHCSDGVI